LEGEVYSRVLVDGREIAGAQYARRKSVRTFHRGLFWSYLDITPYFPEVRKMFPAAREGKKPR